MKRAFASIVIFAQLGLCQSPESKPTFISAEIRASKPASGNGGSGFMGGGRFWRVAPLYLI